MLQLVIPESELFDEETCTFVKTKKELLQLEHSLVSLSKWESKWCKPFLGRDPKTNEETFDYIRCMTITQNVDPSVYTRLSNDALSQIDAYINAKMTATWFSDKQPSKPSREVITSEILYWQMITLNIPFECQKWHLNRLMTLIKVCDLKNQPPKKQGRKEMISQRSALNAARRSKHQTKG